MIQRAGPQRSVTIITGQEGICAGHVWVQRLFPYIFTGYSYLPHISTLLRRRLRLERWLVTLGYASALDRSAWGNTSSGGRMGYATAADRKCERELAVCGNT